MEELHIATPILHNRFLQNQKGDGATQLRKCQITITTQTGKLISDNI